MLVGTGFGAAHVAWLAECKGATVDVLGYRTDEKRARQLAERFGVRWTTTDPVEVIERRKVDIVAVVSPPDTHEPILVAALSAGLPVVSDKPLAQDSAATGRLLELVRGGRRPRRAFVTFQWRHHPAIARLRELTLAGRLGQTVGLDLEFHHDFLAGPGTAWPWRHRGAGAGVLSDQGVHLLDLLRWITPSDWSVVAAVGSVVWPRRTYTDGFAPAAEGSAHVAEGSVECEAADTAEILLRAGDAAHARVAVSRASPGRRALRVVVQGANGLAEVSVDPADGSAALRVFSGDGADAPIEFGPDSMNPYPAILRAVESPVPGVADFADGHAAQLLTEQAMRAGLGKPTRRRADRSQKIAG